jgi:hypothetical protein
MNTATLGPFFSPNAFQFPFTYHHFSNLVLNWGFISDRALGWIQFKEVNLKI